MNTPEKRQPDPNVMAAIHNAGGRWRLVAGRIQPNRLKVVATGEFEVPAGSVESPEIQQWLNRHQVSRVICVLPAGSVICRNCTLPNAGPEQLRAALELQAESQLLGSTPQHRLSMAVLHAAPSESNRCGMILAWPGDVRVRFPIGSFDSVRYTADVAAVAALVNGARPSDPVLWMDRESGALALATSQASGMLFRATREEAGDDEAWKRSLTRVVAETALNAGHASHYVDHLAQSLGGRIPVPQSGEPGLYLPAEVLDQATKRISGAENNSQWWNRFGIAAGALLAMTDQMAPLCAMEDQPPREDPKFMDRVITRLSDRRTALMLGCIAGLIVLFLPLIIQGTRVMVLSARAAEIEATRTQLELVDKRLELYEALSRNSWPATKIISDLVTNAPVGIEMEQISLGPGNTVTASGRVAGQDGVSAIEIALDRMQSLLEQTGIFTQTTISLEDPNVHGDRYRFTLNASLTRPHRLRDYDPEVDFAKITLAERLYGSLAAPGGERSQREEATRQPPAGEEVIARNADRSSATERPSATQRPSLTAPRDRNGIGGFGSDAISRGDVGPDGLPASLDIPPPLTPEQIASMNRTEALEAQGRVAQARNRAAVDEETRARLTEEFNLLRQRLRELARSGETD